MSNHPAERRDGFRSKWGFILACIGSAVGMGNIWRFPIMVSRFGGLTFLLPYFIFVVLIGMTGVIEEFALGRWAQSGPVAAFGLCTEERTGKKHYGEFIGTIPILGSLMLAIGYTVVLGWIFKYAFMAVTGDVYAMGQDMSVIADTFSATAPETDTLVGAVGMMLENGILSVGNGGWQIIGLAVSMAIMALGVANGIEKANKVMMPVLFFLFVGLAAYISTLPGAEVGYRYIFTLSLSGLLDWEVWLFAFGQAFFSLSVAGSGSVIYGSYLSRFEDIPGSARDVVIFDTVAAMLAMLIILPAMGVGGIEPSASGPGLMFIYLPNILNGVAGGHVLGVFFFVAVLFAGVSSIVNLYEAPVALLQEKLGFSRVTSVAVIGAVGAVISLLIQPWTSSWMDLVSVYICPLGALLAGIMFFWVLKKETAVSAVNGLRKKPIFSLFYPFGRYGYCFLALVALVGGAWYFLTFGTSIG